MVVAVVVAEYVVEPGLDRFRIGLGRRFGARYLMGVQFTVADAYLFAILNWIGFAKFTMNDWPTLQAYHARVAALPAAQEAMKHEGLA